MPNHLHLVCLSPTSGALPPASGLSAKSQRRNSDDKYPANAASCTECRASVQEGRWQWSESLSSSEEILCPACHRTLDGFPAGLVFIEGEYFDRHRVELIDLILTSAARARVECPWRRLLGAKDTSEGVVFATTDTELAEEIGGTLRSSFGGDILLSYADARDQLRVHWRR